MLLKVQLAGKGMKGNELVIPPISRFVLISIVCHTHVIFLGFPFCRVGFRVRVRVGLRVGHRVGVQVTKIMYFNLTIQLKKVLKHILSIFSFFKDNFVSIFLTLNHMWIARSAHFICHFVTI